MAEAKPMHLIKNVTAMYPRLDQTYRYDRDIPPRGKTVPCLLYTSPSPRDGLLSRMPSSA